ncbi:MAG: XRE family transcriptional regulator [Gemmatimonadaceae bacterium]
MLRDDPIPALKAALAAELVRAIDGWTPGQLIYRMKIDQPRVSDLRRGRLERISTERLIRWLHGMGCEVEIRVLHG